MVTRRTYQEDFMRSAEKAGLPPEFTPHSLRHSFGTQLLRNGVDIVVVADLMGHATLDTTRSYTR
ncbi:tyrosine-type recombinase/integrase [Nonomuraea africana]|uniref:tyrosine-type recombinase/integrase n=1 Tax=Nonomuraea africana TaxID=46171 RepID=UPI0033ED2A16